MQYILFGFVFVFCFVCLHNKSINDLVLKKQRKNNFFLHRLCLFVEASRIKDVSVIAQSYFFDCLFFHSLNYLLVDFLSQIQNTEGAHI